MQSGVPQGSILGPLLFIITVDSLLQQSFSLGTSISMYADDITLYKLKALSCDEDRVALQSDVTMVELWAESKDLRLNTTKMKAIVISRKQNPPVLNLTLCGAKIEQVSSFMYLGFTISPGICTLLVPAAGHLSNFIAQWYMVLPVLDYFSSICDPLFVTLIDKLGRVQSFAARLVTGRWGYPAEVLRRSLGWLILAKR